MRGSIPLPQPVAQFRPVFRRRDIVEIGIYAFRPVTRFNFIRKHLNEIKRRDPDQHEISDIADSSIGVGSFARIGSGSWVGDLFDQTRNDGVTGAFHFKIDRIRRIFRMKRQDLDVAETIAQGNGSLNRRRGFLRSEWLDRRTGRPDGRRRSSRGTIGGDPNGLSYDYKRYKL